MKTAICFLLINKIDELPELSIKSVISQTNAPIYVGYMNDQDVISIPRSDQVTLIKLGGTTEADMGYQNFGTKNFYLAVIEKWNLFLKLMDLDFDCIIYSDLDLVWVRDATTEISKFFMSQNVEIAVQSITQSPANPSLCMGFFAFRNSSFSKEFILKSLEKHKNYFSQNEFIGDDEVITEMYIESGFDARVRELPQTTFPVGFSIDLYCGMKFMPDMAPVTPYIFHANYVVGARKKRILLRKFLGRRRLKNLGFRKSYYLEVTHLSDKAIYLFKLLVRPLYSSAARVYAKNLWGKK